MSLLKNFVTDNKPIIKAKSSLTPADLGKSLLGASLQLEHTSAMDTSIPLLFSVQSPTWSHHVTFEKLLN